MYIWELMGVTEKLAFQMWKNNIDLLGFMRELLRVGIFTVIFFRKYAQPHFIVCIFTVKMPFFSGKTAENVMGVYGFDCPAIFWDLECSHFWGWQRVCWCTNEAFNQASPTKEFWENCPQKKGGHIYGKNEGWAYLRKLLYREAINPPNLSLTNHLPPHYKENVSHFVLCPSAYRKVSQSALPPQQTHPNLHNARPPPPQSSTRQWL